jgi:hypothetical protein
VSLPAEQSRRDRAGGWPFPLSVLRCGWRQVGRFLAFGWNVGSLVLLLAIVAAIPLVQLAALGYLLRAAGNLAGGGSWRTALPGLGLAGRIGTFVLCASLTWLPVGLVIDLAYRVQLLQPDTRQAAAWRVAAFVLALAWLLYVVWAAQRGGRWWHFAWPRPVQWMRQVWRPSLWRSAADALWDLYARLQFFSLWWLGTRAAAAALMWTAIPVSLMIIGLRGHELKAAGLVGLLGAVGLGVVMLYLPLLQIQFAVSGRFAALFDVVSLRRQFRKAPWAIALTLSSMLALCQPLYLLRIEATPQELAWLPSLFFIGLMLPAKLLLGAALGYAASRPRPRICLLRWSARLLTVAAVSLYIGSLYVVQFVAWQGVLVFYFQHSVLVPTPLITP